MSAIACLYIQPTEAVCNACAELTPVVEPAVDRIYMDWSGCGSVHRLAQRLAELLHSAVSDGAGTDTRSGSAHHPAYRLGVAPVRFIADVLATAGDRIITNTTERSPQNPAVTEIISGYCVTEQTLSAFIEALPITLLPDIDQETNETLGSLAVDTLGELRHINQDLLRNHIGAVADKLLAWTRGYDARPVAALYPPERLRQRIFGEALTQCSASNLQALIAAAAATLAAELQATGRACGQLIVAGAGRRQTRTFTPPITDPDQIARVSRYMAEQLLASMFESRDTLLRDAQDLRDTAPTYDVTHTPHTHNMSSALPMLGDFFLEIIPTGSPHKQMSLWDQSGRRGARANAALDAVRARFGDIIRPAAPREAVVRYEAMFRLYEVNGYG